MIVWEQISRIAQQVGFDAAGYAPARRLDEDARFMEQWLAAGYQGKMDYLARNCDKRYDIRELVPGAQSVIVVLLRYDKSGKDYHRSVKSRLYEMEHLLAEQTPLQPAAEQHIFCDSAPVLERRWAVEAGLGWIGRNHQLIHPLLGSRVHIGELVLREEVTGYIRPSVTASCEGCDICLDCCPHDALRGEWDARRCIAYETFRCEQCQAECPYNKKQ